MWIATPVRQEARRLPLLRRLQRLLLLSDRRRRGEARGQLINRLSNTHYCESGVNGSLNNKGTELYRGLISLFGSGDNSQQIPGPNAQRIL